MAPSDTDQVVLLCANLHRAEAETLVLAKQLTTHTVLVDDLRARQLARLLRLQPLGTVGILLLAHASGIETDVKGAVDTMRQSGFRLSETVYRDLIERLCADPQ